MWGPHVIPSLSFFLQPLSPFSLCFSSSTSAQDLERWRGAPKLQLGRKWSGREMGLDFYGALLWHRLLAPWSSRWRPSPTVASAAKLIDPARRTLLRRRRRKPRLRSLRSALTSHSEGVPPLVVVISCPIAAALVVVPPHRYGEAGRERRAEAIRMGKRRAVVQTSEARRLRDQDLNGAWPSSEAAGKAGV